MLNLFFDFCFFLKKPTKKKVFILLELFCQNLKFKVGKEYLFF